MGKKDHGTKITDLPDESDDENEPDSKDVAVLSNILNMNKTNPEEYNALKYVLFATAIFSVLSLPFTDRIIELALPMANSWLILWGIKAVLFFVMYYIVFYANQQDSS